MKTINKLLIAMMPGFFFSVCVAQDLTVCTSSSYSIPSVTPAGSAATYMWMENGVEIAGATDVSYTNTAGKATAGTYIYTRMAKMPNCNWQASNSFILCVVGLGNAPVITLPANKCSGEDFVFTVPPLAGTKYEWDGGGVAKDNTYTYLSATAGAKTVTVRAVAAVGGSNCSSPYSGATVTVYASPTITTQPAPKQELCPGNTTKLSVTANDATDYQWLKNGVAVTEGSGHNKADYTTAVLNSDAIYTVTLSNAGVCSVTSNEAAVTMKSGCCDAPGSTSSFNTFNPCATAPVNSAWMLLDYRESDNMQMYKVRLMGDGRYWMVQNLKFGKGCNKEKFSGSKESNRLNLVTFGNYGDCRMSNSGNHLYDWAAAVNKPGAFFKGSYKGCTGLDGQAIQCQGICPDGWHVPTTDEFEDAHKKFMNAYGCKNADCWSPTSNWEALYDGRSGTGGSLSDKDKKAYYWSSTHRSSTNTYILQISNGASVNFKENVSKNFGCAVRCVRNP